MPSVDIYLKSTRDFKRVFKEGDSFKSPHFVLYAVLNKLAHSRLGISISKASEPLATRRNRIKRIIRESWRLKNAVYANSKDCVLVVRKRTGSLKNEEILKELNDFFNNSLS